MSRLLEGVFELDLEHGANGCFGSGNSGSRTTAPGRVREFGAVSRRHSIGYLRQSHRR
jgi:hypothetical protein